MPWCRDCGATPSRRGARTGRICCPACRARCGCPGRLALRIARGPAMPMTWGTLAPRILLPAEALSWPADRRRLVLLHELAHVARRDSLGRSAASLACALYWFHPGAWFAARRMRLEQECAADDRVLALGAPARGYALSLLDLARRIGETSRPDHAAAMAGMCQLERRVVAITTPARRDQPGLAFLAAATVAASFVMLVTAAGVPVRPLPSRSMRRRSSRSVRRPEPAARPAIEAGTIRAARHGGPRGRPVRRTVARRPAGAADRGLAAGPSGAAPAGRWRSRSRRRRQTRRLRARARSHSRCPASFPPRSSAPSMAHGCRGDPAAERESDPRIPEPLRATQSAPRAARRQRRRAHDRPPHRAGRAEDFAERADGEQRLIALIH